MDAQTTTKMTARVSSSTLFLPFSRLPRKNTPGISFSDTLFLLVFCGVFITLFWCFVQFPKVVAPSSVMGHMLVQIYSQNPRKKGHQHVVDVGTLRKLRLRDPDLVPGGTELTWYNFYVWGGFQLSVACFLADLFGFMSHSPCLLSYFVKGRSTMVGTCGFLSGQTPPQGPCFGPQPLALTSPQAQTCGRGGSSYGRGVETFGTPFSARC